jgi:hypothetical protein
MPPNADGKASEHWRWKYRYGGKENRLALDSYPDVSLANARRACDDGRDTLRAGSDPVQVKKDTKLANTLRLGNTFEAVARAWFDNWKGPRSKRHADYVIRRLEADVFPVIGAKPVADITAPQLLAMAKKIEAPGAQPVLADLLPDLRVRAGAWRGGAQSVEGREAERRAEAS